MKKIILLALAAASVAAFALPASAMAEEVDVSLHAKNVPLNVAQPIDGVGISTLRGPLTTITCQKSKGSATFTSTTTGTFEQTFEECKKGSNICTSPGQPENSGIIVTTLLTFHLVTAVDTNVTPNTTGAGILVTPNGTVFAHFKCQGDFVTTTVEGNGLVGTITKPACGEESNEGTIQFSPVGTTTTQTHKKVASETLPGEIKGTHTPTEYTLKAFGGNASEEAEGTITFSNKVSLECT
jgi:hypothetical protein